MANPEEGGRCWESPFGVGQQEVFSVTIGNVLCHSQEELLWITSFSEPPHCPCKDEGEVLLVRGGSEGSKNLSLDDGLKDRSWVAGGVM